MLAVYSLLKFFLLHWVYSSWLDCCLKRRKLFNFFLFTYSYKPGMPFPLSQPANRSFLLCYIVFLLTEVFTQFWPYTLVVITPYLFLASLLLTAGTQWKCFSSFCNFSALYDLYLWRKLDFYFCVFVGAEVKLVSANHPNSLLFLFLLHDLSSYITL